MAKNCIFLTGSPLNEDLDFDNDDLLTAFDAPVRRFLGGSIASTLPHPTDSSSFTASKWRILRQTTTKLAPQNDQEATQFLTIPEDEHETLSLRTALHQDTLAQLNLLSSSPIPDTSAYDPTAPTFSLDDSTIASLSTTSQSTSTQQPSPLPLASLPSWLKITDIKLLPNVRTIKTTLASLIYNLIVALIKVHPPRTLSTKYGEKEITDLTVSDDTQTSLTISIWTPVDAPDHPLRKSIAGLRSGDVLLLRNIEMATYRGLSVHGRSVMPRRALGPGSLTGIVKVDDCIGDGVRSDIRGKIERVRRHAEMYVGQASRVEVRQDHREAKKMKVATREDLPPDTQA